MQTASGYLGHLLTLHGLAKHKTGKHFCSSFKGLVHSTLWPFTYQNALHPPQ